MVLFNMLYISKNHGEIATFYRILEHFMCYCINFCSRVQILLIKYFYRYSPLHIKSTIAGMGFAARKATTAEFKNWVLNGGLKVLISSRTPTYVTQSLW